MKRIAIDMDDVMADFSAKYARLFNEKFDLDLTKEQLAREDVRHLHKEFMDEIMIRLEDPTFFRDLEVMADSQEVIKDLSEHYEIFIATAAMEVPASFNAKFEWLKEHFPFLEQMNIVFCGDKSVIHADYLIDDNTKNFKGFKGEGILFSAPHNMDETHQPRVSTWQEIRQYLLADQVKA